MPDIHATAIVSPEASIHDTVQIGPFCIIGPDVTIGANTNLHSNVIIKGNASIGEDCEMFNGVMVGERGQILGAKDSEQPVVIGNRTQLREYVSVHGGSKGLEHPTTVGDDCLLMNYTHLGHDVVIGNKCVLATASIIGGHSHLGDQVWTGGGSAVHQNSWIGDHAFIAGGCILTGDVVPFAVAQGSECHFSTINVIGLSRRGFSRSDMKEIRSAIKMIFADNGQTWAERLVAAQENLSDSPLGQKVLSFVQSDRSGRNLCPYRS